MLVPNLRIIGLLDVIKTNIPKALGDTIITVCLCFLIYHFCHLPIKQNKTVLIDCSLPNNNNRLLIYFKLLKTSLKKNINTFPFNQFLWGDAVTSGH